MEEFLQAAANGEFAMFAEAPVDSSNLPPPNPELPQSDAVPDSAPQAPQQDHMHATPKHPAPWHQPTPVPPPPRLEPSDSTASRSWQQPDAGTWHQPDAASSSWQQPDAGTWHQPDAACSWQQPDERRWSYQEWEEWEENKEETRLAHENKIRWQDRGAPPESGELGNRFKGQVWRAGSERYGNRGGRHGAWHSVYYKALSRGASSKDAKAEADASSKDKA
jgi:hypothetical protein